MESCIQEMSCGCNGWFLLEFLFENVSKNVGRSKVEKNDQNSFEKKWTFAWEKAQVAHEKAQVAQVKADVSFFRNSLEHYHVSHILFEFNKSGFELCTPRM